MLSSVTITMYLLLSYFHYKLIFIKINRFKKKLLLIFNLVEFKMIIYHELI